MGATVINGGQVNITTATGTDASTSSYTINKGTLFVDDSTNAIGTSPAKLGAVGYDPAQSGNYFQTGKTAASSSTSETVGTLTLDSGANSITLTQGTGTSTSTTLTASSLVRNNHAELFVRGNSTNALGTAAAGSTTSTQLTITAAPTGALIGGAGAFGSTTISILPYFVGNGSTTVTPPLTFVTYDTTNNSLRVLNTGTEFLNTFTAATSSTNVRLSNTSTANALTAGTYNSLIMDEATATGAVTDTISAGGLTLNSGDLLFSKSAGTARAATLTGGVLQAAASNVFGTSSTELIITNAIGAASRFIGSQIRWISGRIDAGTATATPPPVRSSSVRLPIITRERRRSTGRSSSARRASSRMPPAVYVSGETAPSISTATTKPSTRFRVAAARWIPRCLPTHRRSRWAARAAAAPSAASFKISAAPAQPWR